MVVDQIIFKMKPKHYYLVAATACLIGGGLISDRYSNFAQEISSKPGLIRYEQLVREVADCDHRFRKGYPDQEALPINCNQARLNLNTLASQPEIKQDLAALADYRHNAVGSFAGGVVLAVALRTIGSIIDEEERRKN